MPHNFKLDTTSDEERVRSYLGDERSSVLVRGGTEINGLRAVVYHHNSTTVIIRSTPPGKREPYVGFCEVHGDEPDYESKIVRTLRDYMLSTRSKLNA